MQRNFFPTIEEGINNCIVDLKFHGREIKTEHWQGIESPAPMVELLNLHWQAPIPTTLMELGKQTKADLPWAEDHFKERIGGLPLNPGNEYRNWPRYKNAVFNDNNFKRNDKFSHTYMERYWPKHAGHSELGDSLSSTMDINRGIRFHYGDLSDIINQLYNDPTTRQAYFPIFFPEDTGGIEGGGRVPCSIGYHFIIRDKVLNIQYLLRACDAKKHFRNDVYLTCRLAQYILAELHDMGMKVKDIKIGNLTMDIISFHVFKPELNLI